MRLALGVACAGLVMSAAPASADNPFLETHYELGWQSVSDMSFDGGMADGGGFRLEEHNGMIGRLPWILYGSGGALNSDFKVKGEVHTTEKEGEIEWVGKNGQVVDRTKVVHRSTTMSMTVVPLTPEEKAARDEALKALRGSALMFMKIPTHVDLMYLPNRDDGKLRGIRGALYSFAYAIGDHFQIAVGYAGARLKAESIDSSTGTMTTIKFRMRAIALRLGFAPARWLTTTVELMPNWLEDYGSIVRTTATVSIPRLERFYGRIGGERVGLGDGGQWNAFFEGGMRF